MRRCSYLGNEMAVTIIVALILLGITVLSGRWKSENQLTLRAFFNLETYAFPLDFEATQNCLKIFFLKSDSVKANSAHVYRMNFGDTSPPKQINGTFMQKSIVFHP